MATNTTTSCHSSSSNNNTKKYASPRKRSAKRKNSNESSTSTIHRLPHENVRSIFESLHNSKFPPPHLKFQIVPVGPNGHKLSPPRYQFENGLYVLLRPQKKRKSPADIPKAPPHLTSLLMKDTPRAGCGWDLSGPQFPQPTAIQQRYCYPKKDNPAYGSQKGAALWTMYDNTGKEDLEFRLLHVYFSPKRAINKGMNVQPNEDITTKSYYTTTATLYYSPPTKRSKKSCYKRKKHQTHTDDHRTGPHTVANGNNSIYRRYSSVTPPVGKHHHNHHRCQSQAKQMQMKPLQNHQSNLLSSSTITTPTIDDSSVNASPESLNFLPPPLCESNNRGNHNDCNINHSKSKSNNDNRTVCSQFSSNAYTVGDAGKLEWNDTQVFSSTVHDNSFFSFAADGAAVTLCENNISNNNDSNDQFDDDQNILLCSPLYPISFDDNPSSPITDIDCNGPNVNPFRYSNSHDHLMTADEESKNSLTGFNWGDGDQQQPVLQDDTDSDSAVYNIMQSSLMSSKEQQPNKGIKSVVSEKNQEKQNNEENDIEIVMGNDCQDNHLLIPSEDDISIMTDKIFDFEEFENELSTWDDDPLLEIMMKPSFQEDSNEECRLKGLRSHLNLVHQSIRETILAAPSSEQGALLNLFVSWADQDWY